LIEVSASVVLLLHRHARVIAPGHSISPVLDVRSTYRYIVVKVRCAGLKDLRYALDSA
jgi:hypothetical protein